MSESWVHDLDRKQEEEAKMDREQEYSRVEALGQLDNVIHHFGELKQILRELDDGSHFSAFLEIEVMLKSLHDEVE